MRFLKHKSTHVVCVYFVYTVQLAISADLILFIVHGGLLLQCASWLIAGGVVVLAETFSHEIYRKSLARLFELDENGYLQMYFNATFDVIMSKVRIANEAQ